MDVSSGKFGVRAELANQQFRIPSGLKCKVKIDGVSDAVPRKR